MLLAIIIIIIIIHNVIAHVPKPRKDSSSTSSMTLRSRTSIISNVREAIYSWWRKASQETTNRRAPEHNPRGKAGPT